MKLFLMKYLLLIFMTTLIMSCTKEKDTIAEMNADDYRIQWIGISYDSIEGMRENYELIELYISKTNDTIFNQFKIYEKGNLKNESEYYNLEVFATNKKHTYKAVVKMHSEYSKLKSNDYNRSVDLSFLNYYQDSISCSIKKFGDENKFEIEFVNYHNDRFTGRITEYIEEDILGEEDMINITISKMALTNKKNTSAFFIEEDSIFTSKKLFREDSK